MVISVPIPALSPLIPSIKLNALMMTKMVKIEKIAAINGCNSYIPKIPNRDVIMTLALNTNIIDANISPAIFLKGDMGRMSSFAPIKKIITKAHNTYCKSPKTLKGVHRITENINPAKIPMPPKEGVAFSCERLSSGISTNFLTNAILIIEGMAK